jgi:hypothetical protein
LAPAGVYRCLRIKSQQRGLFSWFDTAVNGY